MQLKHQVQGRTLIELVVAMALGVILALIVYIILIASVKTQRVVTAVSELSDRAQSIESFLKDYVTLAGFVEYPLNKDNVFGAVSAAVSGSDCGNGFNVRGTACANNTALAQSNLQLRYQANSSNSFMNAAGDRVLDCLGNGQAPGPRDVVSANFYVHNNSLYCASDGQAQPLFAGVRQMRVSYLITTPPPAVPSFRYAAAINPVPTATVWNRTTSVRVCVLLRELNTVALNDGSLAAQVDDCDGVAVNSGNVRHARYQFTFAVRNNF